MNTKRRPRRPAISVAQKILRDWCKNGIVVDVIDGAELVAIITAAILNDRKPRP